MAFHFLTIDGEEAFGGFEWCSPFSDGYAIVKTQGKFGAIDRTGRIVVPAEFDKLLPFSNGLSAAYRDDKRGYIDGSGEWRLESEADYVLPFVNEVAPFVMGGDIPKYAVSFQHVPDGGKWGAISTDGTEVVEPNLSYFEPGDTFDLLSYDGQYVADTVENGSMHFVKRDHTIALGPYEHATAFVDGKALVCVGKEVVLIDETGAQLSTVLELNAKICGLRSFSEGFAVFDVTEGQEIVYKIVNEKGEIVEDDLGIATNFCCGWSAINRGGRSKYGPVIGGVWGFLNIDGSFVTRDRWSETIGFADGVGVVMVQETAQLVSANGDYIKTLGSWARPPTEGFLLYAD